MGMTERLTNLGISLEGMMLKLKLQYFGHLMRRVDSLEKTDAGRDWGQEENGMTEDEMAGWHLQLDGHEFEWTPGVGDGQGGLACCNSWGHRVGHDWGTELWGILDFFVLTLSSNINFPSLMFSINSNDILTTLELGLKPRDQWQNQTGWMNSRIWACHLLVEMSKYKGHKLI